MKLDISESLKTWAEQQAKLGGYSSVDEFVDSVLTRVKTRQQQCLEKKLLDALDSGDPIEITSEFWDEQRRGLDEYAKGSGKAAS